MSARRDLDLIIADWLDDAPLRLPDQTRRAISVSLRTTSQRRSIVGWPSAIGMSGLAAGTRLFASILACAVVVSVLIGGSLMTAGRPAIGDQAATDVGGIWASDDGLALTWETSTAMDHPPYLAAVYYDDFTLHGWEVGDWTNVPRAPGEELLAGTKDVITTNGRKEYVVTVTPSLSIGIVYAPGMPVRMSGEGGLLLTGGGYLGRVERPISNAPYSITSLIRAEEKDGGATEGKLRAAGKDYPAGMLQEYGRAAVPEGTFTTPEARDLLDRIETEAGDNPYDLAAQTVRTLQGKGFTYDVDVRDFGCDLSIVDCFVTTKAGYCEYYASTMVMLLRELDIPARLVEGFLPGTRIGQSDRWEVHDSDAHAWVQVFFPGYGWIDFDPTGGSVAALSPLPVGAAQPSVGP